MLLGPGCWGTPCLWSAELTTGPPVHCSCLIVFRSTPLDDCCHWQFDASELWLISVTVTSSALCKHTKRSLAACRVASAASQTLAFITFACPIFVLIRCLHHHAPLYFLSVSTQSASSTYELQVLKSHLSFALRLWGSRFCKASGHDLNRSLIFKNKYKLNL